MTERDECENCGGPIPPRTDPRGRKARYCSDACRAAASRKRREQRHRDALAEARSQLSFDLRTPEETIEEVVSELRAAARIVTDAGSVPEPLRAMTDAAQALAHAVDQVTKGDQSGRTLSRQQRRKLEREKRAR